MDMLNKIGAATRATLSYFAKLPRDLVDTVLDRTWFTVALFVVIVLPFSANAIYDRLFNYMSAVVQISAVEHVCYVDKGGKGLDEPLAMAPCEALRRSAEAQGLVEDLRIRDATFVSFRYTSPVDGAVHVGRLQSKPGARPPEVDDQIRILISRIDPGVIRN
jgi:hypothetical protein